MRLVTYTAFQDATLLAAGELPEVSRVVLEAQARGDAGILLFDDTTGAQVDIDPRAIATQPEPVKPGRGRPKLGVVAREVTLLPRHWEWLAGQPGGASAALRRLVEEARRAAEPGDRFRAAQTAVYRVMQGLAGDLPGYEEALRALYAQEDARFDALIAGWPADVQSYVARLSEAERTARSSR
jgi:hypothetical protein